MNNIKCFFLSLKKKNDEWKYIKLNSLIILLYVYYNYFNSVCKWGLKELIYNFILFKK